MAKRQNQNTLAVRCPVNGKVEVGVIGDTLLFAAGHVDDMDIPTKRTGLRIESRESQVGAVRRKDRIDLARRTGRQPARIAAAAIDDPNVISIRKCDMSPADGGVFHQQRRLWLSWCCAASNHQQKKDGKKV